MGLTKVAHTPFETVCGMQIPLAIVFQYPFNLNFKRSRLKMTTC
jgi:hypothetical protein